MKIHYTMPWPVDGVCDMDCEYYAEGSLEKVYASEKDLTCGFHCRFDGFKGEGACGANTLSPEVVEDRIKVFERRQREFLEKLDEFEKKSREKILLVK